LKPISRYSRFTVDPDVPGRLNGKEQFGDMLSGWLAALPDGKVNDFLNDVFRRAAQVVARYPRDDDEAAIQRRLDEVYRIEEKRRFPSSPPDEQRKVLTDVTPERNLSGMTEIAFLLQRLKRALEGVRKGDLARSLKVPLPRVSEWLSGRVMPSGETALRLLHWVEQREQKLNALGSASNTTKGKATRRKVVHEKKPTSSHKQE
jgi:DNA-binding transcriptional regulator YiaG